jgi:sugar phosphate isomerase/epimerase
MGYEAVELENAFGKSGAEWRKHLDAAGCEPCGFHHRLSELQGDALAASVEFNQAIGNRNLVIRSLAPAVYQSAELLKTTAAAVNEVAERLRPHQMRVGYHNHTTDFNRIDGEYWWNRFADQTAKDVMLQFDTGNASEMEGVTPQALIRRNAGRTISIHVKPFSKKDPNAYLGADDLDWPAIMTAAETVGGIEWYIIEYEKEGVPPLESLKANLACSRNSGADHSPTSDHEARHPTHVSQDHHRRLRRGRLLRPLLVAGSRRQRYCPPRDRRPQWPRQGTRDPVPADPRRAVVALCDVDTAVLDREKAAAAARGQTPDLVVDYRDLLTRKDVDAIAICTPNHLHAMQSIWAMQAGKDVLHEKPVTHSLWEGRRSSPPRRHPAASCR